MKTTRLIYQWTPLRIPEDGGGGGGGGTGGGDDDLPKTKKELDTLIGNSVNGAVRDLIKRGAFTEGIGKVVGDSLATAMKDFKPATPTIEDPPKDKDKDTDDATKQALAKLKSDNESLNKRLEQQDTAAKEKETKAEKKETRSQLDRALSKAGISTDRVSGAGAFLFHDRDIVKRNDEGEVCIEFKRDWGKELVPIEKGITEWVKTDEGKGYMPPVDAGGSGNTGGTPPGRPALKGDKAAAADAVGKWMAGRLGGGRL